MDGSSKLDKLGFTQQESKRHECDMCELSFKAKISLLFHKATIHKIAGPNRGTSNAIKKREKTN